MIGLAELKRLNDKAVKRAEARKLKPYIAKCDNDKDVFSCPTLGNYIPKGYWVSNEYFIDNSGFGSDGEIALTSGQFLSKVKAGYGYAIQDSGQFQVYIREYKRRK